jgi:hypothetical protein
MLSAGFEPAIPAFERRQIHALDRAASGIGQSFIYAAYMMHVVNITVHANHQVLPHSLRNITIVGMNVPITFKAEIIPSLKQNILIPPTCSNWNELP